MATPSTDRQQHWQPVSTKDTLAIFPLHPDANVHRASCSLPAAPRSPFLMQPTHPACPPPHCTLPTNVALCIFNRTCQTTRTSLCMAWHIALFMAAPYSLRPNPTSICMPTIQPLLHAPDWAIPRASPSSRRPAARITYFCPQLQSIVGLWPIVEDTVGSLPPTRWLAIKAMKFTASGLVFWWPKERRVRSEAFGDLKNKRRPKREGNEGLFWFGGRKCREVFERREKSSHACIGQRVKKKEVRAAIERPPETFTLWWLSDFLVCLISCP